MSVLKIENSSDCRMRAIISFGSRGKTIEQVVDPFQEAAFIVNNIKSFKIRSIGAEDITECTGKFELKIRLKSAV
ncbi:hypothetical protein GCM10010911_20890 [Paenibacillus nasutitermitis]|uniref:Uncharacterized protein n=1 Tax=Paenibacillus nasutitermitis TaxID=1652958 RepID=A0A916YUW9_9BACL|nr:hypothetical protein GCM10010911_20890 [Paenibacillus nasutitermitis]